MKKTLFVFFLLFTLAWTADAQSFSISVVAPAKMGRAFELWLYDSGSEPRVLKPKGKKGVVFTGTLRGATYAELRHPKAFGPLPFFADNVEMTINYNADDPEASPINGSRQNSILRYQLEQCGTADVDCLSRFVAENPSSPVAPYILDRYILTNSDPENTTRLYGLLSGEARTTYHYRHLERRLKAQEATAVGNKMPSLVITNRRGKSISIDSLVVEGRYNVLLVGATYCGQCATVKDKLANEFSSINAITVEVDSLNAGWDAPLMQQLDIDHIPYLLLIGPDRRIVTRDARVWELERIISHREREL